MVKLLENIKSVEAHHEYIFETILKPAVLYRLGYLNKEKVKNVLVSSYVSAIYYSKKKFWIDSSNALPHIIEPLFELFPNAHFIHLLRDGRKVVSSFYNKFSSLLYDDRCVKIITQWLGNPKIYKEPPNEKKYWRPIPQQDERFAKSFKNFSQFQRICFYWQDINLRIHNSLLKIPSSQKSKFYLEDLVTSPKELEQFLKILNIKYKLLFFKKLKRPLNVHIPKNYMMNKLQLKQFDEIAGDAMRLFGYNDRKEYEVKY